MGTELRSLFHSKEGQQSLPSCSNNGASNTIMGQGESLLSRAGRLCQHLRPGKRVRKSSYKPYNRPVKEVQKGLVLIDYQGGNSGDVVPFREYQKLYDGCIRYRSEMSESEVRQEVVRLVRMKQSDTHSLDCLMPEEFDFVRCANRRVRSIDGDAPFDGSGISHVYKNGAIYVRLNSQLLEKSSVSFKHNWVVNNST